MKLNEQQIKAAADSIRNVYETREAIAPLRESFDMDLEDAYAVQDFNTHEWLAEGRRLCGRKIGLTSKAVQGQLGVDQPDFGMLFTDMAYVDGEEVPMSKLFQPKIEGEIAFYVGKDLDDPGITIAELISSIEYAVAAIEIVGSRVKDWDIQIQDTISDNASSGLYVLGSQPVKLGDFDHRLCGMVIEHRGIPVSVGAGAACLGNPINACLWLAKKMVEVGRPLKAGDTILSGALGPMAPISAGETYELRIEGVGSVRAAFSAE